MQRCLVNADEPNTQLMTLLYWAVCIVMRVVLAVIIFAIVKVTKHGEWAAVLLFIFLAAYFYVRYTNRVCTSVPVKLSWRFDLHASFFMTLAVATLFFKVLKVGNTAVAQVIALVLCFHAFVSAIRWCLSNGFATNQAVAKSETVKYATNNVLFESSDDEAKSDADLNKEMVSINIGSQTAPRAGRRPLHNSDGPRD